MVSSFESILENIIPEVNFVTISDTRLIPGALLRSQEDDTWTDNIKTILVPEFFQEMVS